MLTIQPRVHKSFGGVMRELVWHFAELFYNKGIGGCCKAWSVAADLVCKRNTMTVPGNMAVQGTATRRRTASVSSCRRRTDKIKFLDRNSTNTELAGSKNFLLNQSQGHCFAFSANKSEAGLASQVISGGH